MEFKDLKELTNESKMNLLSYICTLTNEIRGMQDKYLALFDKYLAELKENKELQERIKMLEKPDNKVKREPLTDKVVKMW